MNNLPFVFSCNALFAVKHFLITCIEFDRIRIKYFNAKCVKEFFNDTSTDKIISFLKEIKLFDALCFKKTDKIIRFLKEIKVFSIFMF